MAYKEMFFAQAFVYGPKDRLLVGRVYELESADLAKLKAERLADVCAGAAAFSQMVDKEAQDAEEPLLLAFYGLVPKEVKEAA